MTDVRAGDATAFEEDRLPWLEAVEDDDRGDGPSTLKMIVGVLIALVGIGAIVGGIFWMNNRNEVASGGAELIKAPEGPYKVRPDDPGGMAVEGEGDTAFAASAGQDPKSNINTNAVPETPVGPGAQPQPKAPSDGALLSAPPPTNAPPASGSATGAAPAPQAPAGPGGTIQLGAFSSQANATNAWKALSGRFTYLAPLTHNVVPVSAGGKTLYRLRASGPGAANICGRLRVAGETCVTL
ncbi:SPOR domain-containing protein [Sphingosinicella sp. BN140058]|uniref:SPOR domain-containing protein n=1 Tax=Sphingosinicella sp. BN140058 TaxID=1892855 RepID=UPI0010133CCC|nr:SPOR domain-containing protein [Sphingosinicella sp. BN140058]QAY77775.1 SPOR domain-containing protein [Sphingosinicella sp. BN140058]